ncbi:MAG: hypothetical protein KME17_17440 [Cyanosarcina radialis HA8281-LM2]|jgi:hypothetical protein|nr:hypothetical protein [Cyanosarcina radialis HA8281-LM2]
MTDFSLKQQDFGKQDLPDRLHQLAENLSQMQKLCASESPRSLMFDLIKESRYFIEWTVPDLVKIDIDRAAELVDLGRVLTRWLFNLEKTWSDRQEKLQVAQQAEQWLKRVVEMSQLQWKSIK